MKVFIQQRHTRKLLTESLSWEEEETKAKDFGSSVQAIRWAQQNKLKDVQVVLRMDWDDDSALRKVLEHLNSPPSVSPSSRNESQEPR